MRKSTRRRSTKSVSGIRRNVLIAICFIFVVSSSIVVSYYVGVQSGNSRSGLDPIKIYANADRSVVLIQGEQISMMSTNFGPQNSSEAILGSGFVIQYGGSDFIVTNFHVVQGLVNATATFSDGNTYSAKVMATDPYADVALVTTQAPSSELYPLQLTSSSSLQIGDPVAAIGNPYGYSGSITTGIVSQLGRSVQYGSTTGNATFPIADVIQITAPINPGNSGGPLLNTNGMVVGVTTAVVVGSQGLGFAISSDTILRELPSLVTTGTYTQHSYLGIETVDMTFQLAQATQSKVTYGVLVEKSVHNGPADVGGIKGGTDEIVVQGQQYIIGGDIIVSIDGVRIVSNDALSTFLERNTQPGQTLTVNIIRNGNPMTLEITLGTRPPPQA
ncbi:MAG TPA: trypsin-like peptidase domain-containing protein [Candidatus Acidoferrum sp.]|nr:trypsin-like peptidase domain-containing protein [Candidatus Acidoferrum sp.]